MKISGNGQSFARRGVQQDALKINFDITTLNLFCSYALSENRSIHLSAMANLLMVMKNIDIRMLGGNESLVNRFRFCIDAITIRLQEKLVSRELIIRSVIGLVGNRYKDLDVNSFSELSDTEVLWVEKSIGVILDNKTIYNQVANLTQMCQDYINADLEDKSRYANNLKESIINLNTTFRKNNVDLDSEDNEFVLSNAKPAIDRIVTRMKSPSYKLKTGMQGFNKLLAGGFEGSRVYCLFGLPGEGKTTTLINLAYQLKKYNSGFIPKDKTKRPCILFLTMENMMRETVTTLYNITCGQKDMSQYGTNEIIQEMASEGLGVSDKSPIDLVVKYKPINSVDTNYFYTITEDLADKGLEVIAVIFDYIKRIRPVEMNDRDERFRLGEVINELKNFANAKDIPVITASQINREGARIVDTKRSSNKSDIITDIGRSNIGESSLIDENVDASIFIVPQWTEKHKYMGFKFTKMRYRLEPKDRDAPNPFYQPFADGNPVKMVEDFGLSGPLYKKSLITDKEKIDNNFGQSVRFSTNRVIDEVDKENPYGLSGTVYDDITEESPKEELLHVVDIIP